MSDQNSAPESAPPSETSADADRTRPGRTILFGCLTVIVAFALLEFGLRVLAIGAATYEAIAVSDPQGKYVDHPFLTIVMRPNYIEVIPDYPTGGDLIFETNSLGFRGPDFQLEKQPDVYRIVVVGGSAVVTGRTNDDLFTARLEDLLADAFEGQSFEVINAGVPGYTSTQELFLIETQVVNWDPDMVLIYDGRNDMFEGSMPDYVANVSQRDQETGAFLSGREDPLRKHIFTWDLIARRILQVEQYPERDYNTPHGSRHAYAAHHEAVDNYARNLETAIIVLQGYGIQPALAFQPSLLTTGKPLSPEEQDLQDALDGDFVLAQAELLPEATVRMGELAEAYDLPWVDLSNAFDGESERMFLDDVHQTDRGNELIAQALLEMLKPTIGADLGK